MERYPSVEANQRVSFEPTEKLRKLPEALSQVGKEKEPWFYEKIWLYSVEE